VRKHRSDHALLSADHFLRLNLRRRLGAHEADSCGRSTRTQRLFSLLGTQYGATARPPSPAESGRPHDRRRRHQPTVGTAFGSSAARSLPQSATRPTSSQRQTSVASRFTSATRDVAVRRTASATTLRRGAVGTVSAVGIGAARWPRRRVRPCSARRARLLISGANYSSRPGLCEAAQGLPRSVRPCPSGVLRVAIVRSGGVAWLRGLASVAISHAASNTFWPAASTRAASVSTAASNTCLSAASPAPRRSAMVGLQASYSGGTQADVHDRQRGTLRCWAVPCEAARSPGSRPSSRYPLRLHVTTSPGRSASPVSRRCRLATARSC